MNLITDLLYRRIHSHYITHCPEINSSSENVLEICKMAGKIDENVNSSNPKSKKQKSRK